MRHAITIFVCFSALAAGLATGCGPSGRSRGAPDGASGGSTTWDAGAHTTTDGANTGTLTPPPISPGIEIEPRSAKLPRGLAPHFIVGDLNEDGEVDQRDLELLTDYSADPTSTVGEITCLAAGDLNLDNTVDAEDVALLSEFTSGGTHPVSIPAMSWTNALPCSYSGAFAAMSLDLLDSMQIVSLDGGPIEGWVEVVTKDGQTQPRVYFGGASKPGPSEPEPDTAALCAEALECGAMCELDFGCVLECLGGSDGFNGSALQSYLECELVCDGSPECYEELCDGAAEAAQSECDGSDEPPSPPGNVDVVVELTPSGVDVQVKGLQPGDGVNVLVRKKDEDGTQEALGTCDVPEAPTKGGPDPRDEPANIYGEEIDSACPHRKEDTFDCAVLSIDMILGPDTGTIGQYHADDAITDVDSRQLNLGFEAIGCVVFKNTKPFVRPRGRYVLVPGTGGKLRALYAPAGVRAAVDATNDAAMQDIEQAIADFRLHVRSNGVDYTQVVINAHGVPANMDIGHIKGDQECGWLTPSYIPSRVIYRADLLLGNYRASRGKVCTAVLEDMSCYGGLSVKATDELNNFGTATCQAGGGTDHDLHAGHDFNSAFSIAPTTYPALIASAAARHGLLIGMINDTAGGKPLGESYEEDADNAPGHSYVVARYRDLGHGWQCVDHSVSY